MNPLLVILLTIVFLFFGAAFNGLNIGLLMVRPDELLRKAAAGDGVARKLYRYRKNGNYLIVCLLVSNVAVVSSLTLILESLAGGLLAGLLTTALITVFAEIIPQAIFSRRGWRLSRYFVWLLSALFVILWPIAKPMSALLDKLLGDELPTVFSREEITNLIAEHVKHKTSDIDADESRIAAGAFEFSHKTTQDVMTPIANVVAVLADDTIDIGLILRLKKSGHSRFPVYDRSSEEFVGILYMKDLLGDELPTPVMHASRDHIFDIQHNSSLDTALSRFIQTRSHLFLVVDHEKPVGIITLEDVIEEIIKREIEDEFAPER